MPILSSPTVAQSIQTPISSRSTVAKSLLTPILSIRKVGHGVLHNVQLFTKSRRFQEQRQLRNRISWILLTTHTNFFEFTVASPPSHRLQVKRPILSNSTIGHVVYDKFQLFNKSRQFQGKRQLRRVFRRQFQAERQLRTVFWTCFTFLTKVANLKQNDFCAKCFDANFRQQDSSARFFGQVLAC